MSFLTDDDVNKRYSNLFIGLSTTQPEVFLSITKNAAPSFLAQYQASVPGAIFDASPFDPASAGNNITLSGGNFDATFSHANEFSSALGVANFALDSGIAWEFTVNEIPTELSTVLIGAYDETPFTSYDPNLPIDNIAGYQYDLIPNTTVITVPGSPFVNTANLQVGDIIGVVIGTSLRSCFFFRNGVLEATFTLPALTIAMHPGISAVFPV